MKNSPFYEKALKFKSMGSPLTIEALIDMFEKEAAKDAKKKAKWEKEVVNAKKVTLDQLKEYKGLIIWAIKKEGGDIKQVMTALMNETILYNSERDLKDKIVRATESLCLQLESPERTARRVEAIREEGRRQQSLAL